MSSKLLLEVPDFREIPGFAATHRPTYADLAPMVQALYMRHCLTITCKYVDEDKGELDKSN